MTLAEQQSPIVAPQQSLDYRGVLCPLPVIRLAKAIREIDVGDSLEMINDDPGAPADIKAWARQTGHSLVQVASEGRTHRFVIRREK